MKRMIQEIPSWKPKTMCKVKSTSVSLKEGERHTGILRTAYLLTPRVREDGDEVMRLSETPASPVRMELHSNEGCVV